MVVLILAHADVDFAPEAALAPDERVEMLVAVRPDPLHEIERLVEHGTGDEVVFAEGVVNLALNLVVESGAPVLDARQVVAEKVEFARLGVLLPDLQLVELALAEPCCFIT